MTTIARPCMEKLTEWRTMSNIAARRNPCTLLGKKVVAEPAFCLLTVTALVETVIWGVFTILSNINYNFNRSRQNFRCYEKCRRERVESLLVFLWAGRSIFSNICNNALPTSLDKAFQPLYNRREEPMLQLQFVTRENRRQLPQRPLYQRTLSDLLGLKPRMLFSAKNVSEYYNRVVNLLNSETINREIEICLGIRAKAHMFEQGIEQAGGDTREDREFKRDIERAKAGTNQLLAMHNVSLEKPVSSVLDKYIGESAAFILMLIGENEFNLDGIEESDFLMMQYAIYRCLHSFILDGNIQSFAPLFKREVKEEMLKAIEDEDNKLQHLYRKTDVKKRIEEIFKLSYLEFNQLNLDKEDQDVKTLINMIKNIAALEYQDSLFLEYCCMQAQQITENARNKVIYQSLKILNSGKRETISQVLPEDVATKMHAIMLSDVFNNAAVKRRVTELCRLSFDQFCQLDLSDEGEEIQTVINQIKQIGTLKLRDSDQFLHCYHLVR